MAKNDLTIKEIQEKKAELEQEIFTAVKKFEDSTLTNVNWISLDRVETHGTSGKVNPITGVSLDVDIK
jgi:RNA-splicing ligase RtcB